jgi:hypothetical protein
LTERPNRTDQIRRFPPPIRNNPAKYRRPFWLPASNYYILAAAVAIAFFFLVWGVLHEGEDQAPWVPAGFGASLILIGAVFLREIVICWFRKGSISRWTMPRCIQKPTRRKKN